MVKPINSYLNILHLAQRHDREEHFKKELEMQGITDYSIHDGIIDRMAVMRGISNSHKRVVRYAQRQELPNCIIAEDDIQFMGEGAWKYFLSQLEINKDADIFLGMIYEGLVDDNNKIVGDPFTFSGLTLYSVNKKFYDKFLEVKEMGHLDKELGKLADQYVFKVCSPFVAKQIDSFSDNKKKFCEYKQWEKMENGMKRIGVTVVKSPFQGVH